MSGLRRYAALLRLFTEAKDDWTIPEMGAALETPTSTVYRTVRELIAEGFIEPATEGHYRLGSAFVEFDRLIRVTDPIVRLGGALLRDVTMQARLPCVGVLARLYGDRVMCVADAGTPEGRIRTSYERGRPRPLTLGATSKTILAQLPARRLVRLLDGREEAAHPHAPDLPALREELAVIRRRGYCVTRGEVDRGMVGIAAPVAVPQRGLAASLSLVVESASLDDATERRLVLLTVSTASLLTEELNRLGPPAAARGSAA